MTIARIIAQRGTADIIACDVATDPQFTHVVGAGSHVLKSQILLDRMERGEL